MAFGYGDGGGGPTREMLENTREMAAFPAMPRMRQADVGDFFHELEATAGDRLPTWNGELYLELHRGTLTTQSRNKRANRKSEFRLHDAEFLAAMAAVLDASYAYPAATLRQAWELVCLNQFHDIIPGSSIGPVYVESQRQYAEIEQMATDVRGQALSVIGRHLGGEVNTSLLVANPSGFPRHDLAFWPGQLDATHVLRRVDGAPVPAQATAAGTWIAAGELPPFSVTRLIVAEGEAQAPEPEASLSATPTLLENRYLRVELNSAGDITRIYDRANQREILPPGTVANQFQAFEDRPLYWDAWDVEIYFDEKMWASDPAASVTVVETGPLRATLEIRRRILHSDYVQRISLAFNRPGLEVDTRIDWRERHILLKVAFPVDILTPSATYEIQWGNVQRPTHRNTSWDWARFETCGQKWVDLSEGGYGVSLLNDCKYGHDVRDNVMRLSLLRSPTVPDPEADQGEHRFAYTLWPHAGGWEGSTVAAAYALNDPLVIFPAPAIKLTIQAGSAAAAPGTQSFVQCDAPNIVIETIKQAEDGNGLIVRFYESQRCRGRVTLTAGFPLQQAWQTNLLEDNQTALPPDGNSVSLFVRPYQIVTLRLVPHGA